MKRLLFVLFALIPVAAFAQVPPRYVAKFVCGKATQTEIGALAVAPGTYFTAINVHNLSTNQLAQVTKLFSAGNISERPGRMSEPINMPLAPGNTILIDCHEILGRLGAPPFAEGVVQIF